MVVNYSTLSGVTRLQAVKNRSPPYAAAVTNESTTFMRVQERGAYHSLQHHVELTPYFQRWLDQHRDQEGIL
jgi:hypothetical protein